MERQLELAIIRRAYAKQIMALMGVIDSAVEDAFASVRREDFLGPGPWPLFRGPGTYLPSPNADPVYLYADCLVGIVPERGINNGQPSLHAALLGAAKVKPGDHVVHVGAGTGYYTALLARLAGPSGRVTAIEFDGALAARAKQNLVGLPTVQVIHGDGEQLALTASDVIYVNAGMLAPPLPWLDTLSQGGRLILPLTADKIIGQKRVPFFGVVFCIQRRGEEYDARTICPAAFISAAGVRETASEEALAAALATGAWSKVTRLYRGADLDTKSCWLRGPGWCLA
jgi:protein-L-isoaspartate(D-aspartate) O-methyltransferase